MAPTAKLRVVCAASPGRLGGRLVVNFETGHRVVIK
jgi:hypothetical protein